MNVRIPTLRLATGLLLAGGAVAPAAAAPAFPDDARQVAVRTADLDLGSAAGRATAAGRLRRAVRAACAGAATPLAARGCVVVAFADGRAALDRLARPVLAAR